MLIYDADNAGFIRFHLAKRLLEDGEHVINPNNSNDYYSVQLKYTRQAVMESFEHFSGVDLNYEASMRHFLIARSRKAYRRQHGSS